MKKIALERIKGTGLKYEFTTDGASCKQIKSGSHRFLFEASGFKDLELKIIENKLKQTWINNTK